MNRSLALAVALAALAPAPCLALMTREQALEEIRAAKGEVDPAIQATILAGLAWPETTRDPMLHATAREELVNFGELGLGAMRAAVKTVKPLYKADVVAAFVATRRLITWGMPADFLSGLDEALWYGSPEAQRIAMEYMSRYRYPPAVLSVIDAATASPHLARPAILALGQMADDRAWNFLNGYLLSGSSAERRLAAFALARLKERGREALRRALEADDEATRHAAAAALAGVGDVNDLTALHAYVTQHSGDPDELLVGVRERAAYIEALLEASETGAPPPPPPPPR